MFDARSVALSEREGTRYARHFGHIAPDVVLMADGTVMATIEEQGFPPDLSGNAAQNAQHALRSELVRNIADDDVVLIEHMVQHDTVPAFPGPSPAAHRAFYGAALTRDYQAKCLSGLRSTSWFMTIAIRPRAGMGGWREKIGLPPRDKDHERARSAGPALERRVSILNDKVRAVMRALHAFGPRRLGERVAGGVVFSEIAEAHRMVLYGRWNPVPITEPGDLGAAIYTDRIVTGRGGFRVDIPGLPDDAKPHGIMIGFRIYPTQYVVGMFDELLGLPFRLVLTNSFISTGRAKAGDRLAQKARHMDNAGDVALSTRLELEEAMDAVSRGVHVTGSHLWSVAVHVDRFADLADAVATVRAALTNAGAVLTAEDIGCEAAFWAQLPGSPDYLRARAGDIPSVAFMAMSSGHAHPRGDAKHHWGAPIYRSRTVASTAYDVPWHLRDVGHRLRVGPTGSGKTLDMAMEAVFLDPFVGGRGGTQLFFDKDAGNEIMVRAMGGPVARIRRGEDSGAVPLKRLENTEANRAWLHEFISGLIMADGRGALEPANTRRLTKGIAFVMRQPPALRTIAGVRQFLDHGNAVGDGARLDAWCRGGALGWAFDGEADLLDLDAPFASVDPTAVMSDPNVMPPMAAYMLYLTGLLSGTRRVIVHADEARSYLPPARMIGDQLEMRFAKGFEDFLLTGRKLDLSFDAAVQQPEHILEHPIGPAVIAQTKTKVLYPNPDAEWAFYRRLGATQRIHRAVSRDMMVGAKSKIIMRENYAVRLVSDLSVLPHHIATLSARAGRRGTLWLMADCIGNHGKDPAAWLPVFWRRLEETGDGE